MPTLLLRLTAMVSAVLVALCPLAVASPARGETPSVLPNGCTLAYPTPLEWSDGPSVDGVTLCGASTGVLDRALVINRSKRVWRLDDDTTSLTKTLQSDVFRAVTRTAGVPVVIPGESVTVDSRNVQRPSEMPLWTAAWRIQSFVEAKLADAYADAFQASISQSWLYGNAAVRYAISECSNDAWIAYSRFSTTQVSESKRWAGAFEAAVEVGKSCYGAYDTLAKAADLPRVESVLQVVKKSSFFAKVESWLLRLASKAHR